MVRRHLGKICITGLVGLNLAALTVPNFVTADTQTSATSLSVAVDPVIYAYSSGPTVTLADILPDSTGKMSVNSDTVTANTNDPLGFTVTLQNTSAVNTNLTSGGNSFTATAGTTGAPATLVNGKWGWRVDSLASFGAGPTTSHSSVAPTADTFAAIPANGSPFTIKTTSATGSASTTVWYGARANTAQPTGTYTGSVTYTYTTN